MIFSNENAKIGGDRMTSDFMKELLSKDEKITVEYKTCQYGIQEDVYETVCSFSNRYGVVLCQDLVQVKMRNFSPF